MTTLTYMHPHHCNSSANVFKRASPCQRGSAPLGDCKENYSSSLHNESKWWRGEPMHQRFQGSTSQLCCIYVEEWSTLLLAARSTEVTPTIPPCPARLFSTPKALTSAVPEQLLHEAECWAWSGNWAKLKITHQRNEPWLFSWSSSACSPGASSCRRQWRKEGTAKKLLASEATNNQISKPGSNLILTSSNLM